MRRFTDEELVAYVDGEGAADAGAIREAAGRDADLRRRIEAFASSRRVLAAAFQAKKDEPVPDRLLAALEMPKARVAPRPRWRAPLAMAASVLIAVVAGIALWSHGKNPAVALVDSPETLSAALETHPAGVPYVDETGGVRHEVVPVATLRLKDGTWCREFDSASVTPGGPHRTRGLACRDPNGQWTARAVAAAEPATRHGNGAAYRLAGGPELLPAVGPADVVPSSREEALIASHWAGE